MSFRTKCVVIGGANIDMAGISDSPIKMKDSNPGRVTFSSGGVARNIAENLARLGIGTCFLSCVGKDEFGEKILNDCRSSGLDISRVRISTNHPTSIYLSLHDDTGEMKLAVNDMKGVSDINREYLEKHREIIEKASVIVADTNLDDNIVEFLLTGFGDVPVFMDTVSAAKAVKLSGLLGRIHTLKPNKLETEILTGIQIKTDKDLDKAMCRLLEQGIKQVFISLSGEGIYYGNCDKKTFLKSRPANMVSSTGSGDAFMAGLVYSYLMDRNIDQSANTASCAAQLTLESPHAVHEKLTAGMLDKMMKTGVE